MALQFLLSVALKNYVTSPSTQCNLIKGEIIISEAQIILHRNKTCIMLQMKICLYFKTKEIDQTNKTIFYCVSLNTFLTYSLWPLPVTVLKF